MIERFPQQPYTFAKLSRFEQNGDRFYRTPDGKKYLSVTSLLKLLNKDAIKKWRERVGEKAANKKVRNASTRGTFVHNMAEKYLLGEEDYTLGQTPFTIEMFLSMKKIIDKHCEIVHNTEFGLYSHRLKLAGSADLLVTWDGRLTLLDFKTSDRIKKEEWIQNYFFQCTIYSMMLYEMIALKVPKIALVVGVENELPQVFLKNTTDYVDPVITFIKEHHLTRSK